MKNSTTHLLTRISFLILLLASSELLVAKVICHPADTLAPDMTLILKSTETDKDGVFAGTFELANYAVKPEISIPGTRESDGFYVGGNDASIEYLNLNGIWEDLHYDGIVHYFSAPDHIAVKVNAKAMLKARIVPKKIVELSGSDFRIVLHVAKPSRCIESFPFRAYPVREPVKGFKLIPIPEILPPNQPVTGLKSTAKPEGSKVP